MNATDILGMSFVRALCLSFPWKLVSQDLQCMFTRFSNPRAFSKECSLSKCVIFHRLDE